MSEEIKQQFVDQNELRTHQVLVLTGLLIGFITDRWEWVAVQAVVFFFTVLIPSYGPYVLIYKGILKPLGLIKPDLRIDVPQAHRFAMSIGLLVTGCSSYMLFSGNSMIGWSLVWLILILGIIALAGWCAGCFTYYMLNRMGLGGFFKYGSISGTFPGARPGK
ncbi:MAG: DUF4395 domain-containing protein [Gammaproteobacteria bacterium]